MDQNITISLRWLIAICLLLSHFTPVASLPSILDPIRGTTPAEEIQCYSIPYGGIGFASHILTYWTLAWLWAGKKPLWPVHDLKHFWIDALWAATTFAISVALAVFTIIRCRNRWEYMLIAIWKIFVTTLLTGTTVSAPRLKQRGKKTTRSAAWLILYIPGLITGFVGLFPLVKENWANNVVRDVTYAFVGTIIGASLVGAAFYLFAGEGSTAGFSLYGVGSALMAIGILGVLYSDWVLGAIAENLGGTPSGDSVILYWTYFVVKRLPLLSI